MRNEIIINLNLVGYHRWEEAPSAYEYLKQRHRHEFFIECRKPVKTLNREIEINQEQQDIRAYLLSRYGDPCEFRNMSCEQIAVELLKQFDLSQCKVLEDGINGAICTERNNNEE